MPIIRNGRDQLLRSGLCSFEEFVTHETLLCMRSEVESVMSQAVRENAPMSQFGEGIKPQYRTQSALSFRNSTMVYTGKAIDVKQVGEEQGVRHVLEGSVRRRGDQIRVTAQLVDALTGHHLWADRYDRKLDDIFDVQDELTKRVKTELQVKLARGEQSRAWARRASNIGPGRAQSRQCLSPTPTFGRTTLRLNVWPRK